MKLKLIEREGVKHLVVTESLSASDLPVLRAGMRKLLQTGGTGVILDLTPILAAPAAQGAILQALREEAREFSTPLLIVARTGGDATRVEEAVARLQSPDGLRLLRESQLRAEIESAQATRSALEEKLRSHAEKWTQIMTLRGRVSRLKREVNFLERLVQNWATDHRLGAAAARPPTPRSAVIHPVLKRFLDVQGFAKGGAA